VITLYVKYDPNLKSGKEIIENTTKNFTEIYIYFGMKARSPIGFSKTVKYLKFYFLGYKYLRKKYFDPDLIHANIIFPIGIIAYLFRLIYKKPYIISEHWSSYLDVNNMHLPSWQKRIDRTVVKYARRILPVTKNLRDSLISMGYKSKYNIIPNVIDTEKFVPSEIHSKNKSFIHLSSLNDRIKNISGLIQAVKRLSEIRKDFTLNIFGAEELQKHKTQAEELGLLNTFVFFHGEIDRSEVPDQLQKNICLLMFSNFESLPCVIIEALSCGIPVISTDVGGIREYVSEKEGILIPRGDIEKMVEAMNFMLNNYPTFDKSHLREYAVSNFSIKSIALQLDAVYQSLLADV
jgi:glycosyltransferase involved in cell wall biosynthesis